MLKTTVYLSGLAAATAAPWPQLSPIWIQGLTCMSDRTWTQASLTNLSRAEQKKSNVSAQTSPLSVFTLWSGHPWHTRAGLKSVRRGVISLSRMCVPCRPAGHRTLYIGVHVPLGRRSHRRHRHHGHRHRKRSKERDSTAEDGRESPLHSTSSNASQL